jgi:predicted transcriptional regulator
MRTMAVKKKPVQKTPIVSFRCPEDIREDLELLAEAQERSLSNLILLVLKNYISDEKSKAAKKGNR